MARADDRTTPLTDLLHAAGSAAGHDLTDDQIRQLTEFVELLLLWRRVTSLVSQRTASEIVAKHVQDSFSLVCFARTASRVADLGSGAGFPGIPVAILCPRSKVLLVESKRRRANFLRQAVRITRAHNAEVAESRIETLATQTNWMKSFDLVVSRAAWSTADFFSLAKPLLRPGAIAIAMRTGVEPVRMSPPPGYRSIRSQRYELSRGETRVLVVAES